VPLDDWSRDEVEATVADYFEMLSEELAGRPVNKAAHNAALRNLLRDRSKGSVEFKHANISAVLTLHGYPYINGYKPRFNFQALLEQVVLEYLELHRDFFEPLVHGPVLDPHDAPEPASINPAAVEDTPPEDLNSRRSAFTTSSGGLISHGELSGHRTPEAMAQAMTSTPSMATDHVASSK